MRITFKRSQKEKKGFLGGSKGFDFVINAKAQLNPDEKALIEKYKISNYILATLQIGNIPIHITVENLQNGIEMTVENVGALLKLEDDIKETSKSLKDLLAVMASFGGEEVVEI